MIRYYLLQSDNTRYELPTAGLDPVEARAQRVNTTQFRAPGNPEAFAIGDGQDEPGVLALSFTAHDTDPQTLEDLLREIRNKAATATSLIRERPTTALTFTTGGDGDLMLSVGHAWALLGLEGFNTSPRQMLADAQRVRVSWLARFGRPTDSIAESRSTYDNATKVI